MQLNTTSQKKSSKNFSLEIYDDLEELPIYLWWKIHRDGNPLHLIKNKAFQTEEFLEVSAVMFAKLMDDFLDYFGISEEHKAHLKIKGKLQVLRSRLARTGNKWCIGQIMIYEDRLKKMNKKKTQEKINEYESLSNVQMTLGNPPMDPKTMSVIDYYSKQFKAVKVSRERESQARSAKLKRMRNGKAN